MLLLPLMYHRCLRTLTFSGSLLPPPLLFRFPSAPRWLMGWSTCPTTASCTKTWPPVTASSTARGASRCRRSASAKTSTTGLSAPPHPPAQSRANVATTLKTHPLFPLPSLCVVAQRVLPLQASVDPAALAPLRVRVRGRLLHQVGRVGLRSADVGGVQPRGAAARQAQRRRSAGRWVQRCTHCAGTQTHTDLIFIKTLTFDLRQKRK